MLRAARVVAADALTEAAVADASLKTKRVAAVGMAVALLLSTGIIAAGDLGGLNFFVDDRVKIVDPGDLQQVRLPYTIRWTARQLPDATTFAVFLDREPMPPGKDIRWLARDDEVCAADPGCPDAQWLAPRGVHLVNEPQFELTAVADSRTRGRKLDLHTVTVVLLDSEGHRIGESAWTREFVVAHPEDR